MNDNKVSKIHRLKNCQKIEENCKKKIIYIFLLNMFIWYYIGNNSC